jgi:myo-inositol-1(or 4)-monophosphatase
MQHEELEKLRKIAEQAAGMAARELKHNHEQLSLIRSDSGRDIKTTADHVADKIVLGELNLTGYGIISEESGTHQSDYLKEPCWIVDPLDGTLNYTRGFPVYAVSIAFWDGMRPVMGVVHDIQTGHCYSAVVGQGAWCNGSRIQVSGVNNVSRAVLATGFSTGRKYSAAELNGFIGRIQRYKKIRMVGSAAMSLANVAAGRFDAYTEDDIWLWDVAAGLVLVEAAGGTVKCSMVTSDLRVNVTAWNGNFEVEDQ